MMSLEILKAILILRLKYEIGLSLKEIGKACNVRGDLQYLDTLFLI